MAPANGVPIPTTTGALVHNLILFGRVLHEIGLDINPGRMLDTMSALKTVDIGRRSDFYFTLRSLLVNRREDIPLFDAAFDHFWQKPAGENGVELTLGEFITDEPTHEPIIKPPDLLTESENQLEEATEQEDEEDDDTQEVIEVTQTYSTREQLYNKDFGDCTPEEIQAIKRAMSLLLWQLGQRQTRRLKAGRGKQIDLRRSIRRNFRFGAEMLELSHRKRKIKPRPLVVIADVSGSMERYTRLLLQFLYSLAEGLEQRVEVFVFSTRLTRITRQLKNKNVDRALADVAASVTDWSGGTRIGDVIHDFNYNWGRRVLRGGAIVLLISDGWDRGDPDILGKEMQRLQKTSHRLVWLNPLLGSAEYEPLTRGMVAALPYIDDFLPVNNLASLEELALHLHQLDERKQTAAALALKGAAFVKARGRK